MNSKKQKQYQNFEVFVRVRPLQRYEQRGFEKTRMTIFQCQSPITAQLRKHFQKGKNPQQIVNVYNNTVKIAEEGHRFD